MLHKTSLPSFQTDLFCIQLSFAASSPRVCHVSELMEVALALGAGCVYELNTPIERINTLQPCLIKYPRVIKREHRSASIEMLMAELNSIVLQAIGAYAWVS